MKKIFVLFAAMVLATTVSAQSKVFYIAAEAGLNLNKLDFSLDDWTSENQAGFFVGPKIKINIPLVGLGVDAACLYSLNGTSVRSDSNSPAKNKSLSYLEVPVNIRYTLSLFKVLGIYVATGPQYNYCISSDDNIKEFYSGMGLESNVSHSTWGWNVGGGFEIADHFQIGVSYTFPISNSGELHTKDLAKVFTYKQNTVKIRLAYYF